MSAPRAASYLGTLLRRGAPAMAGATGGLDDGIADPAPVPALRRMRRTAGPVDLAARDNLLLRATRYVAMVPLAYRVLAVAGALAAFLAGGHGGVVPVVAVAVVLIAWNVFGLRWLVRSAPFHSRGAVRLLALDVVLTVVANLVVAALVPEPAFAAAMQVPGKELLGGVALLTLALGLGHGLGLMILSVPLAGIAWWFNSGSFNVKQAVSGLATMAGVLVTATGALVLLGLGTRLALAYGIRHGREAERARQHRMLHDTVLQTLETMALPGAGSPEHQLSEMRRLARAHAIELRQTIEGAEGSGPLGAKLAALAAEMARDGLRAQLVMAELDADTLTEVRQVAIRDAAREALRNTLKHSGTDRVVVRAEERDGGVAVVIRDHGAGFDETDRPPGFGISESITARLTEAGGQALVESSPGSGTRVTLWMPR
ncbi:ATP-binding protein [Amycolatopsis endophytica]|uniref:Signal transduction histidine kinase n=1 Tax=Amycolatopsis endophytica TaxID=860233 RepID=A0A853B0E7_9PSEU|nr:ATP-binding protein [Amycolatopsis endophytica]NYI88470.1 signal transduction histidine kinase [Amycolatopsis endophytica]